METHTEATAEEEEEGQLTAYCASYTGAVELIGRRWTGAILRSLLTGSTRFSEIQAGVPGLSDRLLAQRLRELEDEGIVERVVTPSRPVKIEYRLTEKGKALGAVVRVVADWAETWAPR
jgi:DNA-binding HxlR family transcriptional regulator